MTGLPQRVGILGQGLIGGSLARLLAEDGRVAVSACDPDPDTVPRAVDAGVDAHPGPGPWLTACDLVVVATPLDVLEPALEQAAPFLSDDAVVTDVASVKTPVHAAAERLGLGERFVGSHPMAGTEQSGFDHADADLLTSVTWAVTLPADPAPAAVAAAVRVVRFWVGLADARVLVLRPAVHDAAVAQVSHLPHAVANLLLDAVEDSDHREAAALLGAGSFRDVTRVAGTNAPRTGNMLYANRQVLAIELDRLRQRLDEVADVLRDDDEDRLRELLDRIAHGAADVREPDVPALDVGELDAAALLRLVHSPRPIVVRAEAGTMDT